MKAVRIAAGATVAVTDVGEPSGEAFADPVIVHVRSAGICGSDLHLLSYPLTVTLGHEFAGVLDDGTAVAVQPAAPCGACDQCASGATHRCRVLTSRLLGIALDGGLAERVAVERSTLQVLPAAVDVADAALVEPIAVAVRSLLEAGLGPRAVDRILVVGGGSIGLATVALARFWGIEVDLVARHPRQHEAGERLGCGFTPGAEYAVTVDAAGTQSALDEAIARTIPGGTVAIPGSYWNPVSLGTAWQTRQVRLVPSLMYGADGEARDFAIAADVLAATPELPRAMITHRFSLDDAPEAFRVAADRSAGAVKVQIYT